ncbi:hypothetical protein CLAIMM_04227 [Cladophialophora immunda]|nr:hypothetical protein CLAIMM_04227 [Cladophialophora immunda]
MEQPRPLASARVRLQPTSPQNVSEPATCPAFPSAQPFDRQTPLPASVAEQYRIGFRLTRLPIAKPDKESQLQSELWSLFRLRMRLCQEEFLWLKRQLIEGVNGAFGSYAPFTTPSPSLSPGAHTSQPCRSRDRL